jgi:hypothetical protein
MMECEIPTASFRESGDHLGRLGACKQVFLKVAVDTCEAVMLKGHDLFPDFQKLFYIDGEGFENKESLLIKVYGPNRAPTMYYIQETVKTCKPVCLMPRAC